MNKHKPKFMNIVPPGLPRGALSPPYTWEPRERDDWEYKAPMKTKTEAMQTAVAINPMKARIDAIHQQIAKIREEIKQLSAKQHALVQAGKQHMAIKPAGHSSNVESLSRLGLRLLGEARDPADLDHMAEPSKPKQPAPTPAGQQRKPMVPPVGSDEHGQEFAGPGERAGHELPSYTANDRAPTTIFAQFRRDRRAARNMPLGLGIAQMGRKPKAAPPQSPEILQIHQQIQAKRQQIQTLVSQLKQLQAQAHHESTGIVPNYRSCLRLLLK